MRLPATAVLDGWPPTRASGCTEPGLQASSPAARPLTCGRAVRPGIWHIWHTSCLNGPLVSRISASATGSNGRPFPLIERWDSVHWTAIQSRPQSHLTYPAPYHVVAFDRRYAWALGTLIEKWNGTSW